MNDFCFLDLETTGFEPDKDSIIEISFVRFKKGKKIEEIDQVLIPDKSELSEFISNLTGISQEEINETGKNFDEIKELVTEKIGDSIIVGHNIDFDINFLVKNDIPIQNNPRIDTHELARILLPQEKSFALEVLSKKYGFIHDSAHRAMSDVLASQKLFEFLCEKIKKLPPQYLNKIRPALETKTDWYAKNLFLESTGNPSFKFEKQEEKIPKKNSSIELSKNFNQAYSNLSTENSVFLKIGDSLPSATFFEKITEANNTEKFVIISPKLDFFQKVKKFPIPEILFDLKNLEKFEQKRKKLDNFETTFYLKCQFRHFLGFRGLNFFDLFFKENDFWKEVHCQNTENDIFQKICEERKSHNVLAITPKAFFRFCDLEVFKNRILIIDESEIFAEQLLLAPQKEFSLQNFLDPKLNQLNISESEKEKISISTQFLVSGLCKELIEKKLQHKISPFPQKILLKENDIYTQFQDSLDALANLDPQWRFVTQYFNKPEKWVRWINYFPETGNLTFGFWHSEDWYAIQTKLKKFKKIFGHRHEIEGAEKPFFKIFTGAVQGEKIIEKALFSKKEIEIPEDLISQSSPDFNTFCAQKITKLSQEFLTNPQEAIAINFSSLETLKNIYTEIKSNFKNDKNIAILGERVSGGAGKVRELLANNQEKKLILGYQKMIHPDLEDYNWQAILIQKFPFNPPLPLLEKIESVIKNSGQNFWSIWIMPQVAANLARRISCFSSAQKIIFLDPRENAKWGKALLRSAFNEFL